jgi:hypothetical protein
MKLLKLANLKFATLLTLAWLLCAQSPAPTPGSISREHGNQGSAAVQCPTGDKNGGAKSPIVQTPVKADEDQNSRNNPTNAKEQRGTITVTTAKDGWDYALIIATIGSAVGLVGVGIYQAVWLKRTMEATKTSAESAMINAQTTTRLYSPYLDVGFFSFSSSNTDAIAYTLTNYGLGRAFLKERSIVCLFTEKLPEKPEYGIKTPMVDMWLDAGEPLVIAADFPVGVTMNEIKSRETNKILFLYGYYVCEDIFDVRHTVWFAAQYTNGAFSPIGGEIYNRRESKKKNEGAVETSPKFWRFWAK